MPKIWVDGYFNRHLAPRRADMRPVFAREPLFARDFENDLNNDMRWPDMREKNAHAMTKSQIKDELIMMLTSPTDAMAHLVREFNLKLVFDAGRWTRSKEKEYERFFAQMLRDGHPESAHIYRIRQLAVALQRFCISAAASIKLIHWCLVVAGPRPFPKLQFRCCVPDGVQ